MMKYSKPIQIRWSDIDANRHLRHSAYYDYGATLRMLFLNDSGLTTHKLEALRMGPILFREEALFKREIMLEDRIVMDVELVKATADYSRWTLRHHIIKEGDIVAAIITVDAAWIDIDKRKLTVPDAFIRNIFDQAPRANDFQLIEKKPVL